jgi:accessory colonization factor AcfC
MITEFSDKMQADAHSQFQEWRRKNPDGFLLTMKTQKKYVLHRALCDHFDDDTSDSADWSRTKKPKICSLERAELRAWASQREVDVQDCNDCI